MRRELSKFSVSLELTGAKPSRGIPSEIERRRLRHCREPFLHRRLGLHDVEGELEMMIDSFARNEQSHDLRRSFVDEIDSEVAHRTLDSDWLFTATRE